MFCDMIVRCLVFFAVLGLCRLEIKKGRPKRIIEGLPLTDRDSPYSVVRYSVFIAKHDTCPYSFDLFYVFKWIFGTIKVCHPKPQNLYCGGSLLAPNVVLTACHCLANFIKRPGTNKTYAQVFNVLENHLSVYPGETELDKMTLHLEPKKYFVYEQCAQLGDGELIQDYGFIVTSKQVSLDPYDVLRIGYVPTPPEGKIKDLFYRAISEEATCLFVGWGFYTVSDRFRLGWDRSDVLRHGWKTLTTHDACRRVEFPDLNGYYRVNFSDFDYYRDATWACATPIVSENYTAWRHSTQQGDSGSSVTCYNEHFGLVSGGDNILWHFGGKKRLEVITLVAPAAYSAFELAFEQRKKFLNELYWWKDGLQPVSDVTRPPPDEFRNGVALLATFFPTLITLLIIPII